MAREYSINGVTIVGLLLLAALFLIVLVLGMPTWQGIAYAVIVEIPSMWYWAVLGIIGSAITFSSGYENVASAILVGSFVMAVLVGPAVSSWYVQEHIANNQEFEQRAELPETSEEHVRVLPRNVANSYAGSANQLPKYQVGDADIAYQNGSYKWSYGVEPDLFFVALRGDQWGAYYVDMEQTDRDVEKVNQEMDNGMGVLFMDSYDYQMVADNPLVDHKDDTAFVFEHEGETYIARSYVEHDWEFRLLPFPQPYAVPEYGGTQIIDSEGNIQDLSPEEVEQSELLQGQNTYPYDLARYRVGSRRYKNGLMNKMFIGEDVPKIAETGESDNNQPFTVPTPEEDGSSVELTYFVATTPTGSGGGVYQIYTIDSQTGEIEFVEFNDTQTGPKKAVGFTKSQNQKLNWGEDTIVNEPIPIVVDNTLYWHMRVTPSDGSKITYTTFVNADTGNVYRADTTSDIYEFIGSERQKSIGNDSDGTGSTRDGSDGSTFEVIVVEDGEVVETIEVNQSPSVTIRETGKTTD